MPRGTTGGFRFNTIMPDGYPAGSGWKHPPHIYFKVMKQGSVKCIPQRQSPSHLLNETDHLLQRKTHVEQKLMIAEVLSEQDSEFYYRIVLERA